MSKITVADYLIKQLENLGIGDIFGLPGDYNFNIVEAVLKNPNINWIGSTNELNAGYAADGYAREKGYGAVITTYGVGELSAINAIAGCFAEYVPVVKIVGIPSTKDIENNSLIHHNFASPNYRAFERAYSNVVETTAYLTKENAKEEIDRVLSVLINEKKPVYIALPSDVCEVEVENSANIILKKSNQNNLNKALKHIESLLKKAKNPVVVADILVERFCAKEECEEFLERSNYPATTLLMGKSLINPQYRNYLGTYNARFNNKVAYDCLNHSDCPIVIGAILSDINTFGFDFNFRAQDYIEINPWNTVVENIKYENVSMKDVIKYLREIAPRYDKNVPSRAHTYETKEAREGEKLNAQAFYSKIQDFLCEDDIVFCETGTINLGFAPLELKEGTKINNQILWGSIGWATPAAFGAAVAHRDKRIILITGDGSHQFTAQEVSAMMRYKVKPIIIVLNNSGYTIERLLCKNSNDVFNDISLWNYSKLPSVFEGDYWAGQARTCEEFQDALDIAKDEQKDKLCYIEAFMDVMDVPYLAKTIYCNKFALC